MAFQRALAYQPANQRYMPAIHAMPIHASGERAPHLIAPMYNDEPVQPAYAFMEQEDHVVRIEPDSPPPLLGKRKYIQRVPRASYLMTYAACHAWCIPSIVVTFVRIANPEQVSMLGVCLVVGILDVLNIFIAHLMYKNEWGATPDATKCPFYPTKLDRGVWWLMRIGDLISLGLVVGWWLAITDVIQSPYSYVVVSLGMAQIPLFLLPAIWMMTAMDTQNELYEGRCITEVPAPCFLPEWRRAPGARRLQDYTLWDPHVLIAIARFMPRGQLE